ncbi:hypothetical protein [Streptacidiphilus jiangxiensis]|uniref:Uncharacterized protein n=1 Tax=Streptacidiphilus jiangxiensis TaxID=235985 RepID=A0A1H7G4I6_STRJI|nr:hypothetical protein [Streptacidiphilus jiangxiensis]SEK33059.1 hypothetical protein SAMN05414137_101536 [Streptacidiphilus jiangxiensis]
MRRRADELGLALPESAERWGRLAEYLDLGSGRRVMVFPPGGERETFQVRLQAKGTVLA